MLSTLEAFHTAALVVIHKNYGHRGDGDIVELQLDSNDLTEWLPRGTIFEPPPFGTIMEITAKILPDDVALILSLREI